MVKLEDRRGADLVLALTHEEVFAHLACECELLPGATPALVSPPDQVP